MSTAADLKRSWVRNAKPPPPTDSSPPRKRNAAATARALLEAARIRFARDGFEGASLRDIAADVGVDQALVIRYFGSKERLFIEACSPEPKTYGVFSGPREELAERLLDWVMSIEGAAGEGQFVTLLRTNADDTAIKLLRQRLDHFTRKMAEGIDAPNAQLRADLIAAWLLGIAFFRRTARRPSLEEASAESLSPYLIPALERLCRVPSRPVGSNLPG